MKYFLFTGHGEVAFFLSLLPKCLKINLTRRPVLHGFACAKPESAALERNRWCSIPIPPYPIHLHWDSTRDAKHQLPYIMKEWSNIGILMTITVVILKVWEFSLWLETRYHIFSCFQMIKSLTLIFLTCFVITFIGNSQIISES